MKTIKHRIASWLYRKTEGVIKEEYRKVQGTDIVCPNCNTWFSISSESFKHYTGYERGLYKSTCGKCNHTSFWNPDIAPVLILCDEQGYPIN